MRKEKVEGITKTETTKIPEQLHGFNFVLIDDVDGKRPIEMGWTKKEHRIKDPIIIKRLEKGENYGVRCGGTSPIVVDGQSYFLIVVDFDDEKIQTETLPKLPETFTTRSGGKGLYHLYFASDDDKSYSIKNENLDTLADVIGEGKQVIGPGSIHKKTGNKYEVVKDIPFAFIHYSELKAVLMPYDKSPKKEKHIAKAYVVQDDISSKILSAISMETVLNELGIDSSKNPTRCPFHSSKGGKCFSWNGEVAHCFHCEGSWNKYSLIREAKKLTDKQTFEWFAKKTGMVDELDESRKIYKTKSQEKMQAIKLADDSGLKPYFYDSNKIWWLWEDYCWKMVDEVDVLNMVHDVTGWNITDPKIRSIILNKLKQDGRRKKPRESPKSWIQFKEKIIDVVTGGEFEATPNYFVTNPLPYALGDSEQTPTIDKLLKEWVVLEGVQDVSYIDTLFEIVAYSCCQEQFLQTIIALTGSGSNGKGTFLNLITKFIGEENVCSSNLRTLATRNFEASALYKKLVCFFGEVDTYDLTNTNLIKSLTGEDLIRYEFKGKTPFSDHSPTTPIIATNSLPITPDKSIGFFRRWLIIDFPNQFGIKRDLLAEIPEKEFENLGRKIVKILSDLYKRNEFTNAGTIDDRIKRYEERSHPLINFINEKCSEGEGVIKLREFANQFNTYLKSKRLRPYTVRKIGSLLRDEGYEVGARHFGENQKDSAKAILNLSFKEETQDPNKTGSSSSLETQATLKTTRTTEINSMPIIPRDNYSNLKYEKLQKWKLEGRYECHRDHLIGYFRFTHQEIEAALSLGLIVETKPNHFKPI